MNYKFDPQPYKDKLERILHQLYHSGDTNQLHKIVSKENKAAGQLFTKNELLQALKWFEESTSIFSTEEVQKLRLLLRMKPSRTKSGVAIVTVLTKPYPCPGKCIFCPNDIRMPKSYLRDEPGAQRAERNAFDPYLQVYNRLQALTNTGHPTSKIELIILGGTWSYYPEAYQIWFVKRCFDAMNDFGVRDGRASIDEVNIWRNANEKYSRENSDGTRKSYNELIAEIREDQQAKIAQGAHPEIATWEELWEQHRINATAMNRCVGLVIETRPDNITRAEVKRIRSLGCTKVQIGIQTLNDAVNDANKRGHHAKHVALAFRLLRAGGFKIHAHLMPNLYTATPQTDLADYHELFANEAYKPDELKIYPTSVIKDTELYDLWLSGKYQPYTTNQLIDLLAEMMVATPLYCRLTRVIRDIPSTDIEAGNLQTNLREVVEEKLKAQGRSSKDIRWREVKGRAVSWDELSLNQQVFETATTTEYFLSYVTTDNKIAGFLRLSLPKVMLNPITPELNDCAMIREVHVYGQLVDVGTQAGGKAQHIGLGSSLIETAKVITRNHNFNRLAVISAIGTREYYAARGFDLIDLYQVCNLD